MGEAEQGREVNRQQEADRPEQQHQEPPGRHARPLHEIRRTLTPPAGEHGHGQTGDQQEKGGGDGHPDQLAVGAPTGKGAGAEFLDRALIFTPG